MSPRVVEDQHVATDALEDRVRSDRRLAQVNSASRTSIVSICDVGDESSSVAPRIVAQFVECGVKEYIQTILRFLTFMVS